MPCLSTRGHNLVNSSGGGALTGRQTEPYSNLSQASVEKTETYILTLAVVFGWELKLTCFSVIFQLILEKWKWLEAS